MLPASSTNEVGSDTLSSHLTQSGMIELLPMGKDVPSFGTLWSWLLYCSCDGKERTVLLLIITYQNSLVFGVTY